MRLINWQFGSICLYEMSMPFGQQVTSRRLAQFPAILENYSGVCTKKQRMFVITFTIEKK